VGAGDDVILRAALRRRRGLLDRGVYYGISRTAIDVDERRAVPAVIYDYGSNVEVIPD
jgi:hypothetical protein